MRPNLVQGVRLTRNPTVGSVIASHARPTKRIMEAENGSSYRRNESTSEYTCKNITEIKISDAKLKFKKWVDIQVRLRT